MPDEAGINKQEIVGVAGGFATRHPHTPSFSLKKLSSD
jgi:hypothetical protein